MDSGSPSNRVSLREFPPRLVVNPAVTQKSSQFVSGASKEQTCIDIVLNLILCELSGRYMNCGYI